MIECLLHASANVSNVYDSCRILTEETCGKQISTCGENFSGSLSCNAGLGRGLVRGHDSAGLHHKEMHLEIQNKIQFLKLHIVGLLETRVRDSSLSYIRSSAMLLGWLDHCNLQYCASSRIWLMWNPKFAKIKFEKMDFNIYIVQYLS